MKSIQEKLLELGIDIPERSAPAANYANYVIVGRLLFVSGKGPVGNARGKLGIDFTTEQGYQFARSTGIEVLAVLQEALGSLERVKQVVKVQGFINAGMEFTEHHKVLNGFSDLMVDVFAQKGSHARSVLGAVSLRDNLPMVVDSIFEIYAEEGGKDDHENGICYL